MDRQKILVGLLVGVIVLWVYARLIAGPADETGIPAPDIAIRHAGKEVRLSQLRGKVVLIDFWGTWCGPCRMSIPGIQDLYERKRDRGFAVVGVAMEQDDGSSVPVFAKEMGMTYPVGLPISEKSVADYQVRSVPLMVLVDKRGNIRWRQEGVSAETDLLLEQKVEELLGE